MTRFLKITLYSVVALIAICIITILSSNMIIKSYCSGRLYSTTDAIAEHDVCLLLGTTPITRIGNKHNYFFQYRIDAVEELYKAGKVKKILISGDDNSLDGINEVETMRDSLISRGLPSNCFILDGKGYGT